MAFEELDDLLNTLGNDADRATMRDMLARNPNAAQALTARQTVYSAFVDGDPNAMAVAAQGGQPGQPGQPISPTSSAQPTFAAQPAQPAQPFSATPSHPLTRAELQQIIADQLRGTYATPEFATAVEARAKEIAAQQFATERNNLIGVGAEVADQLYTIRASHYREFNEELDSPKFKEFFGQNAARYGNSLPEAYNAYVAERRTQARIDKGIADSLAMRATSDVPGGAIPTTNNPIGPNFVDQMRRVGTLATPATPATPAPPNSAASASAPSAPAVSDAEAAAAAFRSMQQGWTN